MLPWVAIGTLTVSHLTSPLTPGFIFSLFSFSPARRGKKQVCVQGQELLLSGYLLAMPKTAPRATVSCAEMLLEHECKQTPTCCRWERAQPHCTARNHLGWCSGWLCYGVLPFPKPVCSLLAFLQAARLRGSRAEHPTQLLDRGDRQGAGKVAADVGGGFPILPLQG